MSDEAALKKAIIAHPDEDTPRLAYADWLDENDRDPDRAAFLRVQCRLADMSPADPDWVGLIEQQDELVARLKHQFLTDVGDDAKGFYFGHDLIDDHEEPFRRGFPYFISCQTNDNEWTNKAVKRVAAGLTKLVRTTTIRGFEPYSAPPDRLTELLTEPVIANLTGLSLSLSPGLTEAEFGDFYRQLGNNPSVRRVRQLYLYDDLPGGVVAELAKAKTFDSVRRLTVLGLRGPKPTLEKLTSAQWFRRLHHFRCHLDSRASAGTVAAGLGNLPDLHTLDLPAIMPGGVKALAAGKFPALARLMYFGPLGGDYAKALAKAQFPSLAVFEGHGRMKNDDVGELLKAKWLGQLRVLDLSGNSLGDKGIKALVAHPIMRTLRILKLGENAFGKAGLTAIATPGAFPALTALDLGSYHKRKATPADMAAVLSRLDMPNLRHLDLMGWPLGNEGAKALAANPTFVNLTRLTLDDCAIGDPGAKAIFASPHLQNLVQLNMGSNAIKTAADSLADPAVFPRLGECWIGSNRIPKKAQEKLERDGLYLIT